MPYALRNRNVHIQSIGTTKGTGWLPPILDVRDYTSSSPSLKPETKRLKEQRAKHRKSSSPKAMPGSVDLRPWCSDIEDQGQLGSCTAHAAVGIVEYFERRSNGKHLDGSRLFVYKTTRNLIGVTGDTGAWLRNAMGALVTCGVPAETYWPYTDSDPEFDREPSQFVYAVADNFETTKYFAHDPLSQNVKRPAVLESVKDYLAVGVPAMFGFWGYKSFDNGDKPGHIPYPTDAEVAGESDWGHAIAAVGYDDKKKIVNTVSNKSTTGALLIRNSWGPTWGNNGYGWMPYDYVLNSLATDFWSLIDMEYIDTDQFFQ
jgi:C1A family cysteine protease